MMTSRTLLIAAVVGVVMHAAPSGAQTGSDTLLTTLELRQLVARAEPADHARLASHFSALAGKYAAERTRHEQMGLGAAAHPGRLGREHMDIHCKRLVELNADLEAVARSLATYHEQAAAGQAPAKPADPAGLSAGVGARKPTNAETAAFGASADAAKDHRALADYLTTVAADYKAEVDAHTAMGTAYRSSKTLAAVAEHCDRLVRLARTAEREARSAAALHAKLAAGAR